MIHHLLTFALGLLSVAGPGADDAVAGGSPRAFPGAEGFGAGNRGGRGGRVIMVTNLNDTGPGSLRAACTATGPRTVIFRASGTIFLDTLLVVREPYLTIAGQTAPGDGICIANYGMVIESTHDVIVRYLRSRPGDAARAEQDAFWVHSSQDVILDHCSASWGTDETISVTGGGSDRVTVQWCMITESLNNSVHHKGPHGYGSLVRVDGNVSFHHNLYANHSSRNPRPGCDGDVQRGGMLDFRNNVVYNWGERPGYSMDDRVAVNLVANYYRPGPSTAASMRTLAFIVGGPTTTIYAAGNVHEGNRAGDADNWALIAVDDASWTPDARLAAPLADGGIRTETAGDAFARVLEEAGAILPKRDRVDDRIVRQVRGNSGRIIDTPGEAGGLPVYAGAPAEPDSDSDGIPDLWETRFGLNPENAADSNADPDLDGYTNVEEFLNASNPLTKDAP